VFFHTRGKRISDVGIGLGGGRLIHSRATGERVRVDRTSENDRSRRFLPARAGLTL
jgi:cell wall-associated NlpC family hydrolase